MPCTGPSKDASYKEGEEAFDQLMKYLERRYYIQLPGVPPASQLQDGQGFITNLNNIQRSFAKKDQLEWIDAFNRVKQALQEFLWIDRASKW